MTPLSDALTAAQRRALASLEKAYVAEHLDSDGFQARLKFIGIADEVDSFALQRCLDVLREWGAPVPAEQNCAPKEAPMSDGQRGFIADLLQQKNVAPDDFPDTTGLTQVKASELINDLKYGKYDPAKWKVPF